MQHAIYLICVDLLCYTPLSLSRVSAEGAVPAPPARCQAPRGRALRCAALRHALRVVHSSISSRLQLHVWPHDVGGAGRATPSRRLFKVHACNYALCFYRHGFMRW